jgi:hypothetical protein
MPDQRPAAAPEVAFRAMVAPSREELGLDGAAADRDSGLATSSRRGMTTNNKKTLGGNKH